MTEQEIYKKAIDKIVDYIKTNYILKGGKYGKLSRLD
jgi:hypothetical protein